MDFSISKRATFRSSLYFFGTAAIAGILCNFLLFTGTRYYSGVHTPVTTIAPDRSLEGVIRPNNPSCPSPPGSIYRSPLTWEPLPERTVTEIKQVVATTNGFFVRDWSLGLGWNNIRYILETAVLHAQLLNRTLVIPSFVYARACEYDNESCATYARMVNRGDAINSDEWRELPMEKQMAWRIPIEVMIDIPHLRTVHPIVFVSEYLRLRGVDLESERSDGKWGGEDYQRPDARISSFTIENHEYDPSEIVRVDDYDPQPWTTTSVNGQRANAVMRNKLENTKDSHGVLTLNDARASISAVVNVSDPTVLEATIRESGWLMLHTWDGALNMDFVKWVVKPRIDVAPRETVRGIVQQWGNVNKEVLYLKGEIHLYRKPGSLRFITKEKARQFAGLVVHEMRPPSNVLQLAGRITHRIDSLVAGRLWVSAHMRRGDFVRYHWSLEDSIEAHLKRVLGKLQRGRETLAFLRGQPHKTYDIPNPAANELIFRRETPRNDDPYYLATDERDPEALEFLRNNSAIMIQDILTMADRREFGWPLMFTDVVAIVEQTIMSRAGFFYGHGMSSVVGGTVNMRAAEGWDPSTALIE